MQADEIKQRKEQFKEFGEILVRRHAQNYCSSYDNQSRITTDEAAARFGRYLRAARLNRGLSIAELATQTRLSEAIQIALEQGIILSCDIKPKWLRELARVLEEDIDDFNLMLGRKINHTKAWSWFNEGWIEYRWWLNPLQFSVQQQNLLSRMGLLAKPLYVACSTMVLCIAIGSAIFLIRTPSSDQLTPPAEVQQRATRTEIQTRPIRRFSMERSEYDFEPQALVSPAPVVSRRFCCIY
jgi:transcriptional regulator with XRE-family HTH domain